jgi:hypothetical protein
MIRLLRVSAMALLGLATAGCATILVSSHVRRDVDFSRFRSFDWGPADALPTGDPRLDGDPVFKDYLQGAVERRLAEHGLALATAGTPDLLIHYHANVTRRFDVNHVDQEYHDGTGNAGGVTHYEAGTIVLDIIDASTNQLVWRGWAQEDLDGVIGNPRRMKAVIERAVGQMLDRLPPA